MNTNEVINGNKSNISNSTPLKLDAILLMGRDIGNIVETDSKIKHKLSIDGERYLDDFNKFKIKLFGKPLARYYLEEFDKAENFNNDIVVIGEPGTYGIKEFLPELTEGLRKNYIPIEQGKNRFDNVIKASRERGLKGMTYITGIDIPQAADIDNRLKEMGELKTANLFLTRIENFGEYWRNPFFFDGHGYKESQDYLIDLGHPLMGIIEKLNPSTKLSDPKTRNQLIKDVAKIVYNDVSDRSIIKSGIELKKVIGNYLRLNKANKEYLKTDSKKYTIPSTKGGNLVELANFAARALKLDIEDVNIMESGDTRFNEDMDSVNDAYRLAKKLSLKILGKQITKFEELSEYITVEYNGKEIPLIQHPDVMCHFNWDLDLFFQPLKEKEMKMRLFTEALKMNYSEKDFHTFKKLI